MVVRGWLEKGYHDLDDYVRKQADFNKKARKNFGNGPTTRKDKKHHVVYLDSSMYRGHDFRTLSSKIIAHMIILGSVNDELSFN